jgi:hypothetical protein
MGSRVSQIRGDVGAGNGGRNVGVAMGIVRINTGQLLTDADRAKSAFRAISESGKQIGTGVKQGTDTAKKELNSLQQQAQGVARQLASMFALPTAIAFTQQVQRTNLLVRALSGSEELAAKRMDELRKLADRTNQSFVQLTSSATQLLPAIGRNNVDLSQTVLLAQRLALLDPAQGIEGASLAIRELLSGTTTSLAMRFELPKAQLRDILEQAGGDPQKIINGLDQMVAQMGITEQTIVDMGASGINAFSKLKGEVIETTAIAFEPFLNNAIIPLTEGIGDMVRSMRELNPELLTIAGTLGGILATVLALNAAGMGSPGIRNVAALGAAGYVGVEAGTALARAGAEVGTLKNDDLKNVSQEEAKKILAEYLKQATVLFADQLVEIAFKLVEGAITIDNAKKAMETAFDALQNTFEAANVIVDIGFDNIQTVLENASDKMAAVIELAAIDIDNAFRTMLEAIGQLIIDLPGDFGLDDRGQELINSARSGRTSDADRSAVEARRNQNITSGTTSIDTAIADFEARAQAFADILANMDIGLTDEQRQNLEITKQEFKTNFILPIAEALGIVEEKAGSWADRMRERLGSMGAAAAPEPVEEFTSEMLEAFAKFQAEIADLEKKAGEDRKKAVDEAAKKRTDADKKYFDDLAKNDKETAKRRQEVITKSQRDTEQSEIDHRDRINEIRMSTFRDALRAAARIDAVGLRAALERGKEQLDAENKTYTKQKDQRDIRLQEELQEIDTARAERLTAIQQGYSEEIAAIQASRQEKLNQIDQQLRDELQQKNLAFAETHNRLAAEARAAGNHNVQMLAIQQQGLAAQEAAYRAWIARQGGYVPQPAPATQAQVTQAANTVSRAGNTLSKTFSRALSFQTGTGRVPFTGMFGLHENEMVLDPTTSAMMRSLTGADSPTQSQMRGAMGQGAGSNGGAPHISIGSIVLPDNVGSLSRAEIMALAREGTHQGIAEFWKLAAEG